MAEVDSDAETESVGSMESGGELELESEVEEESEAEVDMEPEVEMGKAVRDQLRIWDNLLCLRIQFQKILIEASQLPKPALFGELTDIPESKDNPEKLGPVIQQCFNSFSVLTDNLLDLQELMITKNSDTKQIITRTNKAAAGAIGGKSDGEIASSEDEDDLEKIENEDSGKESEGSDENDDEEDEDSEQKSKKSLKRKHVNDYSDEITKRFKSLVPFRNETIEKWNTKTEVASGKFKNKGAAYTNFHVSTMKQINQVLSDKDRLVRRTQLKRSQYVAIGESDKDEVKKQKMSDEGEDGEETKTGADSSEQNNYNEEIFDDDDFYHQLLREVIERKTSNVHDPTELSTRWLELQKIRGKTKRKVDTKSSKGRKIRYTVLPKLVNFMAPHDECPMTENAYKELLNSLFAN